jgi:hypothetical protein
VRITTASGDAIGGKLSFHKGLKIGHTFLIWRITGETHRRKAKGKADFFLRIERGDLLYLE